MRGARDAGAWSGIGHKDMQRRPYSMSRVGFLRHGWLCAAWKTIRNIQNNRQAPGEDEQIGNCLIPSKTGGDELLRCIQATSKMLKMCASYHIAES